MGERVGEDGGDQGSTILLDRLAAVSNNYGEQQPSGTEGYSDIQDDETQELGRPMTPRRLNAICDEITKVRNEYLEEVTRQRAENKAPTDGEGPYTKEALQAVQDAINEKYLERMRKVVAPLVESDKLSDAIMYRFIGDLNMRRGQGRLSSYKISVSDLVVGIAEDNSRRRKEVLRNVIDLEHGDPDIWVPKLDESLPKAYLVDSDVTLPEDTHCPAIQIPWGILQQNNDDETRGYVAGMLGVYTHGGIISSQYGLRIRDKKGFNSVPVKEIYIESDCGGFTFPENIDDRINS